MTEVLKTADAQPVNPGSFDEFCAREEISDHKEAVSRYSDELHRFRVELAHVAGVSLEALHDMRGHVAPSVNK